MSSSKTIKHIVIIGGGISGLASALALHALGISCSIYEVRAVPSTLGGAVNLTPAALRCLDHIGVLKHLQGKGGTTRAIEIFSTLRGVRLGELSFRNVDKIGYHALRILRAELQQGMLSALEEADLKVEYGKKLVDVRETAESVEANFEDGSVATGDILLGCDGIHSIARTKLVESDRIPVYSGVAVAYGLLPASSVSSPIHFEDCSVNSSRRGTLLAVFCDPAKQRLYFAAVMEMKEQANREGWKVKGSDQDSIRMEILSRFGDSKMVCLREMIENVEDLFLFPVYTLPPGGKWSSERVLLLGDAAHAVSCLYF
jgi:2-polyprenyl-6-methoxyphenol hydroxylase-like FAD-dependent oxidoreductase